MDGSQWSDASHATPDLLWPAVFRSLHIVKETLKTWKAVGSDDHSAKFGEGHSKLPCPDVGCSKSAEIESLLISAQRLESDKLLLEESLLELQKELAALQRSDSLEDSVVWQINQDLRLRDQKIMRLEAVLEENSHRLAEQNDEIIRLAKLLEDAAETVFSLRDQLENQHAEKAQLQCDLAGARHEDVPVGIKDTADRAVQCQRDHDLISKQLAQRESEWRSKFQRELDFRDQDYNRLLSSRDKDIHKLQLVMDANAVLRGKVQSLQQQIEKLCVVGGKPRMPDSSVPKLPLLSSRHLSVSQCSNMDALVSEQELELESASIRSSISRHSSLSRTEGFRYKDLTPKRLAELQRRNSIQLPHLKSSYPVEQSDRAWRHDSPEQTLKDVHAVSNMELSSDSSNKCTEKATFLKTIASTFRKGKKATKAKDDKKDYSDKENKVNRNQQAEEIEKPVAFVVDIAPGKKIVPKPKR